MLTVDFETEAIDGSPSYNPPKPVGVSILKEEGGESEYWAWGHPTENNCTFEQAKKELLTALTEDKEGYIAHNASFEAAILKKYFGYSKKDPLKIHDTQFLLFLTDPYANTFSLKPSAERILGMSPDEQDAVKQWVLANVPGAKASEWGAHICKAPGSLVGRYAGNSIRDGVPGDTDRTRLLFDTLHPRVLAAGMLEPYRREQKLMPILAESSKRGVRLDTERLSRDIEIYIRAKEIAENYIRKSLGDFNIDSDVELAAALDRAGQVTEWVLTPTGRRSTARKNLVGRVKDPQLLAYMAYRGVLATCLGTFAGPWLEQALKEGGRVHPSWNQVRGEKGEGNDMSGTKTGRMSCKYPNLQNPPNDFDGLVIPDEVQAFFAEVCERIGSSLPVYKEGKFYVDGTSTLSPVPHMRVYLLPEEGHVWLKRDFSAQEMRIMAHFAEGRLYEAFKANPRTDPHDEVKRLIDGMIGGNMPRKFVKITGFGIMYGRGVANLSLALGVDQVEGQKVRDAYYSALPEIRDLSSDIRNRGRRGQYIRTWGGRVYYKEPNPDRDLSYKLLNYLIQGSAADQTKQSMVDFDEQRAPTDILLAAVHDEINISAPKEDAIGAMQRLRLAMDADRFDVPFCSEGFIGPNWADIMEYEE